MPVICRLPYGGGGIKEIYDFPLTISNTQPTAVRNGHIWVKADIASQISTVKIVEAVNAGESNGTLMLVVGDLVYRNFNTSHSKTLTNGGTKNFSIADSNTTNDWLVQSISGDITSNTYLRRPLVYSKIGGVLDMETAYMWNGSSWVLLSQKGSYIAYTSQWAGGGSSSYYDSNFDIYNFNTSNNELTLNARFPLRATTSSGDMLLYLNTKFTRDGNYLLHGDKIYKRQGDVFTLYFTAPSTKGTLTEDGQILVTPYYSGSSAGFRVYRNDGSTFVFEKTYYVSSNSRSSNTLACVSANGKAVLLIYPITVYDNLNNIQVDLYIANDDGTFPSSGIKLFSSSTSTGDYKASVRVNPFTDAFALSTISPVVPRYCNVISIANKTYKNNNLGISNSIVNEIMGWLDTNTVLYAYNPYSGDRTYIAYDISTNTFYDVVFPSTILNDDPSVRFLAVNSGGNKVFISTYECKYHLLSYTKSSNTITFSLIKTLPSSISTNLANEGTAIAAL